MHSSSRHVEDAMLLQPRQLSPAYTQANHCDFAREHKTVVDNGQCNFVTHLGSVVLETTELSHTIRSLAILNG